MRFLLIDRISSLKPGEAATGIKNVTMSEDFLAHHFPDRPIMPGLLIIEALVQLADWLIRVGSDFKQLGLATSFDRAKFRRVVRPGDQLLLEVNIQSQDDSSVLIKGKAYVQTTLVASCNFTLTLHPIDSYLSPKEAERIYQMIIQHEES
jgi:3-hydroxyacyl-[acyl-carrier-protein] dehydratase